MRRVCFVFALMIVSMFGLSAAHLWANDITYNIVDYPNSESGDTISGTITTDGTIGQISTSNIVSAAFTIATPTYTL